jgi:hypothetical protein
MISCSMPGSWRGGMGEGCPLLAEHFNLYPIDDERPPVFGEQAR